MNAILVVVLSTMAPAGEAVSTLPAGGSPTTTATEKQIVGRASVIDGDTIEIHGERIRLNGIDAPESRQLCHDKAGEPYRCGQVAAMALDDFLASSRPTSCYGVDHDRYRRLVANCFRADGESVAEWLVENGHALDWPRYSLGAYSSVQEAAKDAGKGVWRGRFDLPWEWRKARQ